MNNPAHLSVPPPGRNGYGRPDAYGPPVACKHCGSTDVYWQQTRSGHRLHQTTDLQPHVCPTSAEGFGDSDG